MSEPEAGAPPPRPGSVEAMFARFGPAYRWLATASVMLGTVATVLTATIVNVALPDIMGAFGMGQDKAQLLSTSFLAAMTGTMLLNAWMVESFGQRATYLIAVSVFILASIAGGTAPDETVLIVARILQGGAAGILQPLSMQVIFQVFPPDRRGSAMGVYGIGVVLAPALGPTLGGIMVDDFSWRYVFFMTVPFCIAALFLSMIFVPTRSTSGPPRRFDWLGLALLAVFLVTLLNGLSNGQRYGWLTDKGLILDFLATLISGAAFIAWERHTPTPMLNLGLFANSTYAGASVVAFIYGAGIYGSTYLVPLFVQSVQGYTPTRAGLVLMPAGLILAVIFPVAGRLTDRTPAYVTVIGGLVLFSLSAFLMSGAGTDTPFWTFAWWIMLGRIGLGFITPSLNAGALRALPLALIGQGSGAINFLRQLGGAFGVNLLSILVERRGQLYSQTFTATQDAANTATAELLRRATELYAQAGVPELVRDAGALDYLGKVLAAQSSMMGYRDGFMVVAAIFMLAIFPALLMRQRLDPPPR